MHAFDRQTDGQTDGRTDRNLIVRPRCIPCSAVKMRRDSHYMQAESTKKYKSTKMATMLTMIILRTILVYKALHGQLPQYLAEDCQLLTDTGRRSLRSSDVLTCATRTRTRLGDRSFSVAGPFLWNSLPVALRDRGISLAQFKRLLKTLWFV